MSRRALRIRFWGNFGTGNLGNECTLQAILHNFRRWLPDAELGCICPEPQDVLGRHGISAVALRLGPPPAGVRWLSRRATALAKAARALREVGFLLRSVWVLRGTDGLVVAGTGVLTDTGEGVLGLPYELFRWTLAARCAGCRVFVVGVGVEEIRRPLARFFITSALRLAAYRSYRDTLSRDRLLRAGFAPARQDPVYPDLAFSLPPQLLPVADEKPREPPRVAVGLYGYQHADDTPGSHAYSRYLEKTCALILRLVRSGHSVRLVVGDIEYDRKVRHDVRAGLEKSGQSPSAVLDEPAESVAQLIEQLASVDVVVAARFHNLLLGLLLGTPVVSIGYDAKNDALMNEIGLGRFCQALEAFEVDRLVEHLEQVGTERDRLRPAILAAAARYREQLEEQYSRIAALLGSSGSARPFA